MELNYRKYKFVSYFRFLMKLCWLIPFLFLLTPFNLHAQMVDPPGWADYDEVLGVKSHQRQYDFDVTAIYSSVPSNVLWPGEQPHLSFQITNNRKEPIRTKGKLCVIRYGTISRPNDIWLPQMVKFDTCAPITVQVNIPSEGFENITVDPYIPDIFGGYAFVLDLGRYGRRLVTSMARTFSANPLRIHFPKQSLDDLGADFLQRLGVQSIRYGVGYTPTNDPSYAASMEELGKEMEKYAKKNITVMLMFGAGGTADNPLERARSFLDSNAVMLKTKQDYVWLPKYDPDFSTFVKRILLKYGWPKGPVTAVALWNEPWEGISISGWQSDIPRYREIYKAMADGVLAARKEGADVLVGGTSSSSNAWDKLFADGKMTFLPIFDFCSIHYQGMESPALYPQWIQRQSAYGRVKIWDTESWVGNTDDRIGLVIATNRSAGYDRCMGIYGGYMITDQDEQTIRTANGKQEIPRIPMIWSQSAAMGAVQHFLGERNFKELLFKKGLPWIMIFSGLHHNEDDGTVVVSGDIGEAFGEDHVLFRGVKGTNEEDKNEKIGKEWLSLSADDPQKAALLQQLNTKEPLTGGVMTISADPAFRLYDFYGNPVKVGNGVIQIPLSYQGYFLRTDGSKGSFQRLLNALQHADIKGYEPLEIVAKDMTRRIEDHPVLTVQLTNILNHQVSGRLSVKLGKLDISYPDSISIPAHTTKVIQVKVVSGKAAADNTYPLMIAFNSKNSGNAIHGENMHVNLVSHLSIKVDGQLNDWQHALAQTVSSSGSSAVSLTEAAWYPFKNFNKTAGGYANGYLAYDDHYFYFAAKVADSTLLPGSYRFTRRPDDSFFYPDTSYQLDPRHSLIAQTGHTDPNDDQALESPAGSGKASGYWEAGDNTNSFGFCLRLPQSYLTKMALYFPNPGVPEVTVDLYNDSTNKLLASHTCTNLWDGVYLNFEASGKIRVEIHNTGWWYNAKLAGIFFDREKDTDKPATAVKFINEDPDTHGNWKNKYGNAGYYIAGLTPHLNDDIRMQMITRIMKDTLIWPKGVRHFTYRKDPVTPDNSGLGYKFDNVLIAFNVIPVGKDGLLANPPGTMPRYTGYKCTDYEYALNKVAPQYGGGTEIWRLLAPGMNRKHFFPRQPESPHEGAVTNGKLAIQREGNTLIYECALPWSEIPDVKKRLDEGKTIKFSFRVNDNSSPDVCMELAKDRSVSKINNRAFHPDWKEHWANEVEFGFGK